MTQPSRKKSVDEVLERLNDAQDYINKARAVEDTDPKQSATFLQLALLETVDACLALVPETDDTNTS